MASSDKYKLVYLARRAETVSREDWPRTWRSHAIFASQFPVLETELDWLRYCNRVDQPSLDGKPVDLPELSTAHDGVAVVASGTYEGITADGFTPGDRAKIDEDERRVFDMLTPNFSFFGSETIVKDGPLGEAALFRFLPRGPGLDREAFSVRYRAHAEQAGRAVAAMPGLVRAVLNHPMNEPRPLFPFDGISEYWFASADDAVRALAAGSFGPITDDLGAFSDLDGSVLMLTSVFHRWSEP